jgi:hypothetical protein
MYRLGKVEEQADNRQATPMVMAELRMTFNCRYLPIRMNIPHIFQCKAIRPSCA